MNVSKTQTAPDTIEAIEAALDELDAALWKDNGIHLRLEDPTYKFVKREVGGYYVEFAGQRLGWVVKNPSGWACYTYGETPGRGTLVDERSDTRSDVVQTLAMRLTRQTLTRSAFLIYWEKRLIDDRRFAELMARVSA